MYYLNKILTVVIKLRHTDSVATFCLKIRYYEKHQFGIEFYDIQGGPGPAKVRTKQ